MMKGPYCKDRKNYTRFADKHSFEQRIAELKFIDKTCPKTVCHGTIFGKFFRNLFFYLLQVGGISAGMENIKDNNSILSDFINDLVIPDYFKTDISGFIF